MDYGTYTHFDSSFFFLQSFLSGALCFALFNVSLRVNLDMGKSVYSMQIMRDNTIPNTVVRTSTIPEELGRIEYLLTDKTGTLTKNGKLLIWRYSTKEMELKRLHLGTMSYGVDSMDEITMHLSSAFSQKQGIDYDVPDSKYHSY